MDVNAVVAVPAGVAATLILVGALDQLRARRARRAPRTRVLWRPTDRAIDEATGSHVYIIRAGDTGRVKIGVTTSLRSRLPALATGMAGEWPRVEAIIPGDHVLEQRLHHAFRRHHVRLEWFDLPPDGGWRRVVDRVAG